MIELLWPKSLSMSDLARLPFDFFASILEERRKQNTPMCLRLVTLAEANASKELLLRFLVNPNLLILK